MDIKRSSTATYAAKNERLGHPLDAGTVSMSPLYPASVDIDDGTTRRTMQFDEAYTELTQDFISEASISSAMREVNDVISDTDIACDDYSEKEYERTLKNLYELASVLDVLESVNAVVADCLTDDRDDARCQYIAESFTDFIGLDAGDGKWEDNLEMTMAFLEQYQQKVAESVEADRWLEKIDVWRAEFAAYIASPAARGVIGEESATRAVSAILTVPIRLVDPLTTLIRKQGEDDATPELAGWFLYNKRTVHIDPFTIEYTSASSDKHLLDIGIKEALFHELTHAITNHHYMYGAWPEDNGEGAEAPEQAVIANQNLWPEFWYEGMTEKIAFIASAALMTREDAELINAQSVEAETVERSWRACILHNPPSALSTNEAAVLQLAWSAAYRDFRLLIDAMFAKLDWQAAGLTPREAETLAAHAFTETPEDGSANRYAFIDAVNKAAHPGFFMKLQHAVDIHGIGLMTRVLLNPNLDIHDPGAMPFTTSFAGYDFLEKNICTWQRKLQVLERHGFAAGVLADMARTAIEGHTDKCTALVDAVKAERTLLEHKNPKYFKLIAMLLGEGFQNSHHKAQDEVTKAEADLAKFVAGLEIQPRTPFSPKSLRGQSLWK